MEFFTFLTKRKDSFERFEIEKLKEDLDKELGWITRIVFNSKRLSDLLTLADQDPKEIKDKHGSFMFESYNRLEWLSKLGKHDARIIRALMLKAAIDLESHQNLKLQQNAVELLTVEEAKKEIEAKMEGTSQKVLSLLADLFETADFKAWTNEFDGERRKSLMQDQLAKFVVKVKKLHSELDSLYEETRQCIRQIDLQKYPNKPFRSIIENPLGFLENVLLLCCPILWSILGSGKM